MKKKNCVKLIHEKYISYPRKMKSTFLIQEKKNEKQCIGNTLFTHQKIVGNNVGNILFICSKIS